MMTWFIIFKIYKIQYNRTGDISGLPLDFSVTEAVRVFFPGDSFLWGSTFTLKKKVSLQSTNITLSVRDKIRW